VHQERASDFVAYTRGDDLQKGQGWLQRRFAGSSVTLLKKLGNTMAWGAEKSSKQRGMISKKSFTLIS
jgi:hypothetical protein